MLLCYLIDPDTRSVTKVRDGFDRAPDLTNSDEPLLASLWHDLSDPDASVDIAYAPDAGEGKAFELTLTLDGQRLESIIRGKGVLIVCGTVPAEIATQVATTRSVADHVAFLPGVTRDAAAWLRERAPAKRATAERASVRRTGIAPPRRKAGAAPRGRH